MLPAWEGNRMLVSQAEQVCVDAVDWSGCVILQPTPNGIALLKKQQITMACRYNR